MAVTSSFAPGWQGPLTRREVGRDADAALFGSATRPASREGYRAEAVRLALWAQSRMLRKQSPDDAAVATHTVLAMARAILSPFTDCRADETEEAADDADVWRDAAEEDGRLDRSILDLLAEQGDVQDLGGGRWLPAPLRLVPLIADDLSLLVGCRPTRELPGELRGSVEYVGMFRRIAHSPRTAHASKGSVQIVIAHESLDRWLGPTPPTLDALVHWVQNIERVPLAHPEVGTGVNVEIYAANVKKPQGLRWLPLHNAHGAHAVQDGCYLTRMRMLWWSPRYTITDVRHGKLTAQSHPLPAQHIRRLCYALDRAAGNPTSADWDQHAGIVILHSELPARERKLLATLGTLEVDPEHYYPRRWTHLPLTSAQRIERMLDELGIRVVVPHTRQSERRLEGHP